MSGVSKNSRVMGLAERLLCSPKYLTIDGRRADDAAKALVDFPIILPTWDFEGFCPQSSSFEETCLFYLIFNSINYCYFDAHGDKFREGVFSGSDLVVKRLIQKWDEIKDPHFLANIDENYLLLELLHADFPISMAKERTEALREIGRFIVVNPDFKFDTFFRKYKKNAYFVSQALPIHLPTWRDPFFKRAQLFVGMVYGRFQDWDKLPIKEGLDKLTVFADYKIPQTLIAMGVIEPGPALKEALLRGMFLESGSKAELEIRAAAIVGANYFLHFLRQYKKDSLLNALHVDFILWSAGRKKEQLPNEMFVRSWLPHHLLCLKSVD